MIKKEKIMLKEEINEKEYNLQQRFVHAQTHIYIYRP